MSTIRPFLSSGVRLAVVPDNSPSPSKVEHGENGDFSVSSGQTDYGVASENGDFSIELEGSCELMSYTEPDAEDDSEEAKKHDDEQRHKRVLNRWMDYLKALFRRVD